MTPETSYPSVLLEKYTVLRHRKKSHHVSNIIPPMISFYLSFPDFSWEQPYLKTKAFISVWQTLRSRWIGHGFQSVQVWMETAIYFAEGHCSFINSFVLVLLLDRRLWPPNNQNVPGLRYLISSTWNEPESQCLPSQRTFTEKKKRQESRLHHFWFVWSQRRND